MIFKDYYKILGLSNSSVTPEVVKQAYREQAKKYHPDINTTNNLSEERFKDINEAYKVLSNSSLKRRYDRTWKYRIRKKQKNKAQAKREKKSAFAEFFQIFFGEVKNKENNIKDKNVAIKGENIETEITISIFDAFYGVQKNLALRAINGKMREFKIKIPAGIRNEEKIRLIGQGKSGENGGKAGDLLVKIHIKNDKKFELNGVDLYTDLYVTPWEAALGTKLNISSIDEQIQLYIPKGTQGEENLKLKGKGYLDGKGGRGDLIINIKIMISNNMSEEEKKLFEQLKEISKYNPREIHG